LPGEVQDGEPFYVVTYKMENTTLESDITASEFFGALKDFTYEENAGYTVYKGVVDGSPDS
jgi:hypothetical protein